MERLNTLTKRQKIVSILVIGVVICVLIWAIVLRVYGLSAQSFWIDEAYSIATAQAIVDHGYPLLDSGQTQWRSPFYHYALAGMIVLFGDGEVATRMLSVVAGLVAIGVITSMAYFWFEQRVAVISCLIISLSYWEIAWSRQARMYMLLQVLFWASVMTFERWQTMIKTYRWTRKETWAKTRKETWAGPWLWWCIGLTIAAMSTHEFALVLPIAYGLYCFIQWLFRSARPAWQMITWYVGGLLLIWFIAIGLIHWFSYRGPLVQYAEHYVHFLTREYVIILLLALVGIWTGLRRKHQSSHQEIDQSHLVVWLASITILFISILSYGVPLLHYRYMFMIVPVFILLAAVGMNALSRIDIGRFISIAHSTRLSGWLSGFMVTVVVSGLLVSLLFSLLFSSGELTFLPRQQWLLESDQRTGQIGYKSFTPQPPFQELYALLSEVESPVLITPYPAISRLYRDMDDTYALPISLTGGSINRGQDRELYTGIPYTTAAELKDLVDSNTIDRDIYIVLDTLALQRIDQDTQNLIDADFIPIYHGMLSNNPGVSAWTEVWLYRH